METGQLTLLLAVTGGAAKSTASCWRVLSAVTCLQEEQTGLGDLEAGVMDAGQLQGVRCPDSNTETASAPLEVRLSPEGNNELCKQHQQQPGSRQQR